MINDSTILVKGICNKNELITLHPPSYTAIPTIKNFANIKSKKVPQLLQKVNQPSLVIHGNVLYNFNYRSYLDTPFVENDLVQQSIQTSMNVLVKNQYPFTVYLTHRNSNSPYFLNATDVSVQYNKANLLSHIKNQYQKELDGYLYHPLVTINPEQLYNNIKQQRIQSLIGDSILKNIKDNLFDNKFKALFGRYTELKDSLALLQTFFANGSSNTQKLIEEREEKLYKQFQNKLKDTLDKSNTLTIAELKKTSIIKGKLQLPYKLQKDSLFDIDSTKIKQADSLYTSFAEKIQKKRQLADSIKKRILVVEKSIQKLQSTYRDSLYNLKKKVAAITDRNSLEDYLKTTDKTSKNLSGLQKILVSVESIGIGRTWLDYSELTVKNVALNGINIELNPSNVYIAAAVGKINYGFRDFILKGNNATNNHSLALVRFGYGQKKKNNLIATFYSGSKPALGLIGATDSSTTRISGFSLEGKWMLNENNYFIGEYARSTYQGLATKMFQWSTQSNAAWAVKLFSKYPKTNTDVYGYYRKTGEQFQSFSMYLTNVTQDAWALKVKQPFWKKRFMLEASVRKNDFANPALLQNISASSVFKTLQLSFRKPHYPFMMIGYYPSSQLTVNADKTIYESHYNTLNAVVNHTYAAGKLNMNSNFLYTKFYNQGSDSGFVYYNASSITFSQSIFEAPFTYQAIVTNINQLQLKQWVVEPIIGYQIKNRFCVSGSAKWITSNTTHTLWGGTGSMNFAIRQVGSFQFQYEKNYLPGFNNNLIPVDIGRLTFNREF